MTALALAVCVLAACGKDSSRGATTAPRLSGAERSYATQLQSLCIKASRADASVPLGNTPRTERRGVPRLFDDYRRFLNGLAHVHAPGKLARDHRARLAFGREMVAAMDEVRTTLPEAGPAELAQAYDLVGQAYARDDTLDAQLGLVDCIWLPNYTTPTDAYPPVRTTSVAHAAGYLNRICIDNATRAVRARTRAGKWAEVIDAAAAERLSRLVAGVGRPANADARYTGWTDSLKTVANLLQLASHADGQKARALREQAQRTAAAGRKTADQLGLGECAKGNAAAAPAASMG